MSTILSSKGYGILKEAMDSAELHALRKELTVSPVMQQMVPGMTNNAPSIKLYMENTNYIYVPKYFGLQNYGVPEVNKIMRNLQPISIKFKGSLRDEQLGPVEAFMRAAQDPEKGGGIINLSCGAGKTVIGLYILSALAVKTIIIVHKEFLLDQWKERINMFLPNARVGLIKAKIIDVTDKDIVIASLQSLSMKDYAENVFQGFGLVIIDEVHRTATEVFSQALKRIQVAYTLGLSATVTRKDGLSKVFKWYLGDIIYKKKRKSDNVIVHIEKFEHDDESYSKEELMYNDKPVLSRMINNIAAFYPRTARIVEMITSLIDHATLSRGARRKLLVLSDRKSHLKDIGRYLPPSISHGFYIGNMKPEELAQSETKDVILATYSFASEGFDAKDLDTLILATPKTDIEQSVGRVLRKKEEDRLNIPIVIDIVDMFSIFPRQGYKRCQFYKKHGFKVQNVFTIQEIALLEESNTDEEDNDNINACNQNNFGQKGVCAILDD